MEGLLANWYTYIYDNMYALTSVYDKLTTYSDAIADSISETGTLHSVYLLMMSLGIGMLVVYFVITLGTRLQGNNASPAVFFKSMLEFFVGYELALNSFSIVRNMFLLGDSLGEMLVNELMFSEWALPSLDEYREIFAASISNIEITNQVLYMFKALIPYLACMATTLFLTYTIVTRVLRVCVNAVMSPIAVANYFEGSRRSDAIKFLKRTAAMSLQCSVIMLIVVAVTDLSGFIDSEKLPDQRVESSRQSVAHAGSIMVESAKNNYSKIKSDMDYAVDKLGMSARNGLTLKDEYKNAYLDILENYDHVTSGMEAQYQGYESLLKVNIFKRNETGSSYVYDPDTHYAKLDDKYMAFSESSVLDFMSSMLGSNNILMIIMLLAVKVGMIKQSMSFCNTIVGV